MVKHMADVMDGAIKELPGRLQLLLGHSTKNFGVPAENIYINIDYWEPGWWVALEEYYVNRPPKKFQDLPQTFWDYDFDSVSAMVTLSDESASSAATNAVQTKMRCQLIAYKAVKLREFQEMCASGVEYQLMNRLLDKMVVGFYESRFEEMLEFHVILGKMANKFWKAKEKHEQRLASA
ncbi:hypothetical protein KCU78_g2765, partial [Aureobasidium melanogenum]